MIDFINQHKEVLILILGVIVGGLVPAIYSAVAAFTALAVSLAPFLVGGLIVGGFLAACYLLIKNWKSIKDFFQQTWDGIKIIFNEAIDWIVDKLQPLLNIMETIKSGISSAKEKASSLIPDINIPSLSIPDWLHFDEGGVVPGRLGQPVPAIVHGGEEVIPVGKKSGNTFNFTFQGDISDKESLIKTIINAINRASELKAFSGS
jgi:hypothetical protein